MPMISTAGNFAFLVFVGAAIAFLMGSEVFEARRSRSAPRLRRARRLPGAVLRRLRRD